MKTNCRYKDFCEHAGICVITFGGSPQAPTCFKKTDCQARADWLEEERKQALVVLRRICAMAGDNDWPDNLHLVDILSKHLEDHLNA